MYFNLEFILIAAFATIFAGISKGGFGSGAAFASAAILATIIEPGSAIGIMLPLLILMDLGSLKPYWKKWSSRESWILVVGSIPGVILGAVLYSNVSADFFRFLIGIICLVFVLWQALQKWNIIQKSIRPISDFYGFFLGCFAGFTSFISHTGGPPWQIFTLPLGLAKSVFVGTSVIVFSYCNVIKLIPYIWLGQIDGLSIQVSIIMIIPATIAVYMGVKLVKLIPEDMFFKIVTWALFCISIKLIWDGLRVPLGL